MGIAEASELGLLAEFWLRTVRLRPSTVNGYRQHVVGYLVPCWVGSAWTS
jgi:hypothetical protein